MRQVAVQVYVKELLDGVYEEREGWEPNVLLCARGSVSRVNVLGVLLRESGRMVLDDGSGQVGVRVFDEVPGLDTPSGSVVQVIGRPRVYNDSLYLVAEIIKPLERVWAQVRKARLGSVQSFSKPVPVEQEVASKEVASKEVDNKAEHVVSVISGLDDGEGAFVEEVIEESGLGSVAEQILNQLLLDGEVFEIKPGVVKVL